MRCAASWRCSETCTWRRSSPARTRTGSTGWCSPTSASTRARSPRISDLCRTYEAKLSLVSPLRGQATPHQISRLAELPVFEYVTSDVSRSTMMLKRALDLIVGIPLALLAAPLFPLIALGDLARGPRPGAVRPVPRRPRRRALPAAQVPDHARGRRPLAGGAARGAAGADVQVPPGPARHPRRPGPAPAQPRRAATALEPAARRHEPGRPASRAARAGRALQPRAPLPARA